MFADNAFYPRLDSHLTSPETSTCQTGQREDWRGLPPGGTDLGVFATTPLCGQKGQ